MSQPQTPNSPGQLRGKALKMAAHDLNMNLAMDRAYTAAQMQGQGQDGKGVTLPNADQYGAPCPADVTTITNHYPAPAPPPPCAPLLPWVVTAALAAAGTALGGVWLANRPTAPAIAPPATTATAPPPVAAPPTTPAPAIPPSPVPARPPAPGSTPPAVSPVTGLTEWDYIEQTQQPDGSWKPTGKVTHARWRNGREEKQQPDGSWK